MPQVLKLLYSLAGFRCLTQALHLHAQNAVVQPSVTDLSFLSFAEYDVVQTQVCFCYRAIGNNITLCNNLCTCTYDLG